MSSRVSEILSVLRQLKSLPASGLSIDTVRSHRIAATKRVAESLGITHETVRDALTRQLSPHVNGIRQFDALVLSWRQNQSRELEHAIRNHAVDGLDDAAVTNFFASGAAQA